LVLNFNWRILKFNLFLKFNMRILNFNTQTGEAILCFLKPIAEMRLPEPSD
jgi:hypothetical protein